MGESSCEYWRFLWASRFISADSALFVHGRFLVDAMAFSFIIIDSIVQFPRNRIPYHQYLHQTHADEHPTWHPLSNAISRIDVDNVGYDYLVRHS